MRGSLDRARPGFRPRRRRPPRGSLITPAIQGVSGRFYLGIAEGALATAAEYSRTTSRPWGTRQRDLGHDRFGRNVRTHILHDPAAYKRREVGDLLLNGTHPGFTLYT
ncbi:acyl-CoA dehydrogenase family protein [Amycolatopsis thermoflava]|uniref:hypothetical protein n=1 Tax=Amycolatopsis thermoflava TaxID=84480 RepID=UPI00041157C8|nr:hypothetical protein [Amycolatopsis thermoflava]